MIDPVTYDDTEAEYIGSLEHRRRAGGADPPRPLRRRRKRRRPHRGRRHRAGRSSSSPGTSRRTGPGRVRSTACTPAASASTTAATASRSASMARPWTASPGRPRRGGPRPSWWARTGCCPPRGSRERRTTGRRGSARGSAGTGTPHLAVGRPRAAGRVVVSGCGGPATGVRKGGTSRGLGPRPRVGRVDGDVGADPALTARTRHGGGDGALRRTQAPSGRVRLRNSPVWLARTNCSTASTVPTMSTWVAYW